MLLGQKGVKYGLTVRAPPGAKPAAKPVQKKSVFGDEDSEEEGQDNVEQQIARQAARKQTDKKVADLHAAALAEDAAIFDYDGHYDSIQESRAQPKKQEKLQRSSRYIAGLLEKAEERKKEQDILYERQLAKERAAEDHLFGDKEKFVTAAYRAKLAERQVFLEEQKRIKEREEEDSVEKRGHMGDFYRNLLRSNVAFGAKPGEQPPTKKDKEQRGEQAEGRQREQRGAAPGSPAAAAAAAAQEEEAEPEWVARGDASAAAAAGPAAAAQGDRGQQEQKEPGAQGAAPPAAAAVAAATQQQQGEQKSEKSGTDAVGAGKEAGQAPADAGQRRNKDDTVAAARERYLARKRQKTG